MALYVICPFPAAYTVGHTLIWKVVVISVFEVILVNLMQKATKWSERRDAVAELTKLASTKKIAPGDFNEVSRTLKKVTLWCIYSSLLLSFLTPGDVS
jgi:hypothetical protein